LLGSSTQPGARQGQQRAQLDARASRHAGEARWPRAAQQLQQHRLELVLGVVREQQPFARRELPAQRTQALLAGRRFQRFAARHPDRPAQHRAVDLEQRRARASGGRPAGRARLQGMVDVQRAQLQPPAAAQRGQRDQQRHRVGPARAGYAQPRAAQRHAERHEASCQPGRGERWRPRWGGCGCWRARGGAGGRRPARAHAGLSA
jgi:hypothetical protein